jgi:hypothetical protein
MAKKPKKENALAELLEAASPEVLIDLILKLVADRSDVRRECFDFLKKHVSLLRTIKESSESEVVLDLWDELRPDLRDLDDYGGGDYDTEDYVAELLEQIRMHLNSKKVALDHRCEILDQVLTYIKSGNALMDDMLYEVAYAACYNDSDLRRLAEAFEVMQDEWKVGHARDIYRRIRDRDKYLELRFQKMVDGGYYFDLATFYWESGEKEKAIQVADGGLRKGQ